MFPFYITPVIIGAVSAVVLSELFVFEYVPTNKYLHASGSLIALNFVSMVHNE